MLFRIIGCLIIGILLLSGCKSHKRTVTKKKRTKTERVVTEKKSGRIIKNESSTIENPVNTNISYSEVVTNYIEKYSGIAKDEMTQYGIPASITLAQGILESGAGRGELTRKANNHFGIKCHSDWTGERAYHDDDENQECFRKYKDPRFSFRDHSLFLSERSRYQNLFRHKKDDYKAWAKGLRKAGYATDPKYPQKLIRIIEKYNLSVYDRQVLGGNIDDATSEVIKISTHLVKKGDTLYSISKKYQIDVDTLKAINGLQSNEISIGQKLSLNPINN